MDTEPTSADLQFPPLDVSFKDDPRVLHEATTEDYSKHVMPLTWRASKLSSIGAFWGLTSAMFWLIFAALIALTVGSRNAIIGLVMAVVFYGVTNYFVQAYAARTGTSVALFSRTLFGYHGAALAPLLFAATAIYYAVFEGSVIAQVFKQYFGGSITLWYAVVIAYSIPIVFGGVLKFLDKFNGFLLPFYAVGVIGACIWSVVAYGYHSDWLSKSAPHALPVPGPGWLWAFTSYVALAIVYMYTWDYARFSKVSDAKFNGIVSYGVVFWSATILINGLIGIFLTSNIPTNGPLSELSGVLGMVTMAGGWAVALVWISQTRVNSVNMYVASSNLENFVARVFKVNLPRVFWVVVVGVICFVIMQTNVFTYILKANQYQGVVVLAWVAVALCYILGSHAHGTVAGNAEWRPGRVPPFDWGGLVGWAAGSAAGFVLLNTGSATSWTRTWTLPFTFVVAAVVYLLMLRFARQSWFVMERPGDPRLEVTDPWDARVRCYHCDKSYIALEMDRDPGAGHQAICASCAQAIPHFYRHARQEHARYVGSSTQSATTGTG